jgi:hypothetical protein
LQSTIASAESWTRFLNARRPESLSGRPEEGTASVESIVAAVVSLGEALPATWRLTFNTLLCPGGEPWTTVEAFEAIRQQVRRLFFTTREAMDRAREVADAWQARTGKTPAMLDRLLAAIENAARLEESVFRDWPSFADPLPSVASAGALPVDESLAEALGITVEEARLRLDARRRELEAGRG